MAALTLVNPRADFTRSGSALGVNTRAAKGLQDVLKSNLGPKGTVKMLVGGAGQIKLTKDGNVLLHEMQIQHPTASLIARTASALDDITGDGSTTNCLIIGELMKLGERYISEGVHPHLLCEGIEIGRKEILKLLSQPSNYLKSIYNLESLCRSINEKSRTNSLYEKLIDFIDSRMNECNGINSCGLVESSSIIGKYDENTLKSIYDVWSSELFESIDRYMLASVARTSLRTKLHSSIADKLTEIITEAILIIRRPSNFYIPNFQFMNICVCENAEEKKKELCLKKICRGGSIFESSLKSYNIESKLLDENNDLNKISNNTNNYPDELDLFMVEIMHMKHMLSTDTRLIKGMVLDHGGRHPGMPEKLSKCFILTLNVSLEYEKTEVNSGFFYKNVLDREKAVIAERKFTDDKVIQIIKFREKICSDNFKDYSFVVLNQKGIDPPALDLLAKAGILGLRRVKRRNMERLTLCCGGNALNCLEDMKFEDLGYAETVHQEAIGDEKYTFIEGVRTPRSCCILIKGQNDQVIAQCKDAIRDGLRAVKNAIQDSVVLPGAGAFEFIVYDTLEKYKHDHLNLGKVVYGLDILAQAFLVVIRTLCENSGYDYQNIFLLLQQSYASSTDYSTVYGVDLYTPNSVLNPISFGIFDNLIVKRNVLSVSSSLVQNLLQVDEIIRAGKAMGGGAGGAD